MRNPPGIVTDTAVPAGHGSGRGRVFGALYLAMFAGLAAGIMVNANIKQFLPDADAKTGALAVSLFAVANALGRVGWGVAFDRARGGGLIQVNLLCQAVVLGSFFVLSGFNGGLSVLCLSGRVELRRRAGPVRGERVQDLGGRACGAGLSLAVLHQHPRRLLRRRLAVTPMTLGAHSPCLSPWGNYAAVCCRRPVRRPRSAGHPPRHRAGSGEFVDAFSFPLISTGPVAVRWGDVADGSCDWEPLRGVLRIFVLGGYKRVSIKFGSDKPARFLEDGIDRGGGVVVVGIVLRACQGRQ